MTLAEVAKHDDGKAISAVILTASGVPDMPCCRNDDAEGSIIWTAKWSLLPWEAVIDALLLLLRRACGRSVDNPAAAIGVKNVKPLR